MNARAMFVAAVFVTFPVAAARANAEFDGQEETIDLDDDNDPNDRMRNRVFSVSVGYRIH